ncbi:efflux RND transporter periplasmic adaptor subunit [Methylicorpusculum oleiharenae]|uniref:efflux RND transporter periplasmic adaptor subunit n=1 Tax=Methylicorpusculum oleiharenae TaxID=1338687 RepID=UPI0013587A9C|nr:efflux RND transporter periplasmic adaptor subunit [Methylicorpusculum oleiharenae]MCD2451637.1 efflux RND transporter periplasmic adaptor subunit [Methylicorpusculum oleiharenae]
MLIKNLITRRIAWLVVSVFVVFFAVYKLKFTPIPVFAHTVAQTELHSEIMGTGTLEARVKTTISSRIQERLVEVLVDQGDTVTAGQLLARLDSAELDQQVAVAQAALAASKATVERVRTDNARAQAVLQLGQVEYKRYAELAARNFVSQSDLDKTTQTLGIAEAELKRSLSSVTEARTQELSAKETLRLREEQLTFTELRSPYAGLVVRRDLDPGVIVVPGASILQLIDTRTMWINTWVDETAIAALAEGQPARVVFRSEPDQSYPGQISRLGREADRETREFQVDVLVQQLPVNWAVGQRAEVYIETGHQSDAVTIPQQFLLWRAGKPGVMVNDQGKAYWRDINLGLQGLQATAITRGLAAGEQIVKPLELKQTLEDGQAVTVQ